MLQGYPAILYYSQESLENLQRETALSPSYTIREQPKNRLQRIVDHIWRPYLYLHASLGRAMFWARYSQIEAKIVRPNINLEGEWLFLRLTLRFGIMDIDAMIATRAYTKSSGRWLLPALGLSEIYEYQLAPSREYKFSHGRFSQIAEQLNANILFFNYPEMGASTGQLTRETLVKSHEIALDFLEHQLEPKEIILYGHSTGAVVQGLSLLKRNLFSDLRYVVVADRTFSEMAAVLRHLKGRLVASVFSCLGWNMSALSWYRAPTVPTIVISAIKGITQPTKVDSVDKAVYVDDTIPFDGSLVCALKTPPPNTRFFGVPEQHKYAIQDTLPVVEAIEDGFKS